MGNVIRGVKVEMQSTFENLVGLERKLNVTVPVEHIEDKVSDKLREITSKAKLPGFRPGKVPVAIIEKKYAGVVRADILESLIRTTYVEALKREQINPAGLPKVDVISAKPGEPLVYTATFEVYPEVKLIDLKQIEVEKPTSEVSASDVDEMLEKMRKSHVTWQEITDVERKSQLGDQLTMDLTIVPCANDKKIEPKVEKDIKFTLGDGHMWSDFEKPLYGLGAGEEKRFILEMPATHADKELAGKRADFTVKVHKVCEPILPDLDDQFAAKMQFAEGGLAKLKEEVRAHMQRELEIALKKRHKQAIMDKLLEHHSLRVLPQALVEKELARQEMVWRERAAYYHKNAAKDAPKFPRDEFKMQAERNVALGLLMSAIVDEQRLRVEPQEVRKKAEDLVREHYGNEEVAVNKLLSDQERLAEIAAHLLEEKVLEYLAGQVNCIEKNVSYKDALASK